MNQKFMASLQKLVHLTCRAEGRGMRGGTKSQVQLQLVHVRVADSQTCEMWFVHSGFAAVLLPYASQMSFLFYPVSWPLPHACARLTMGKQ